MGDLAFQCPGCTKNLAVGDTYVGLVFSCPDCHAELTAPRPTFVFACSSCGEQFCAPDELKGQVYGCPTCEALFEVPVNNTVRCDGCGIYLEIEEEYYHELQGQVVECPQCERQVTVPGLPTPIYEEEEPEEAVLVTLKCHGCLSSIELTPEKFERMKGRLVRCAECRRLVRVPLKPPSRKRSFEQPPTRKAKTQKMVDAEAAGTFAKTMRLDDILDGSTQARTVEEGVCLYCNSPLKQVDDHTFVCESCWRVIRTVKRRYR